MQDDVYQNLKKIGPAYSTTAEKQAQVVQMIKRGELQAQMKSSINPDIQGLRKKRTPFSRKPNNRAWWASYASFERNGMLNVGLSRNWVRLIFPVVPMFMFIYIGQPIIHGTCYIQGYNNFQWNPVYHKFQSMRMIYCDNTITRIA